MKKRRGIILGVAGILVMALMAWWVLPRSAPEPSYDGHPLSYWLSESEQEFQGFRILGSEHTHYHSRPPFLYVSNGCVVSNVHHFDKVHVLLHNFIPRPPPARLTNFVETNKDLVVVDIGYTIDDLFMNSSQPLQDGYALSNGQVLTNVRLCTNVQSLISSHYINGVTYWWAVQELGTNAIPTLLECLRHEPAPWKTNLQAFVNRALGWVNPKWHWKDRNSSRLYTARWAFSALGPHAKPAIPELARLVHHSKSLRVAEAAVEILGELGHADRGKLWEETLVPLTRALKSPRARVRFRAISGLAGLRGHSLPAVPQIIECLKDRDERVASTAAEVLGSLGLASNLTVMALTTALNDTRAAVRSRAAKSLGDFGSRARSAVPTLVRCLQNTDERTVEYTCWALSIIKGDPELVVPALMNCLQSSNARCRSHAARALGAFGPAARPAASALSALLNDPDREVRYSATNALSRIDFQALTNFRPQ